jgi:transcriptional regulator with XRE-family HTH domain
MAIPGEHVGDEVRALRLRHGLTQKQVCARWGGRAQPNLARIENNRRRMTASAKQELIDAIVVAASLAAQEES